MRPRDRLWILIADGEHARIAVPGVAGGSFQTQWEVDSAAAHRRSRDLGTDKPGRGFESGDGTRHAIAPKHDPHTLEKQRFEHFIAERLNAAAAQAAFDQLVLVAPAQAMHEIRQRMDQTTAQKLAGTLTKDLTKLPDHALGPHLVQWTEPDRQEEN